MTIAEKFQTAIDAATEPFHIFDAEIRKTESLKTALEKELVALTDSLDISASKRRSEITAELSDYDTHLQFLRNKRPQVFTAAEMPAIFDTIIDGIISDVRQENAYLAHGVSALCVELRERVSTIRKRNTDTQSQIVNAVRQIEPWAVKSQIVPGADGYLTSIRHKITNIIPVLPDGDINADVVRYL